LSGEAINQWIRPKVIQLHAEAVETVLTELGVALNDSLAAHSFASFGLTLIPETLQRLPRVPENPDPAFMFGVGDPNTAEARQYAQWPISTALEQVAGNGPVEVRLSQQWVVFFFALWEHEYRPRLATAHHCSRDDLKYPLLGDLRRLRNDVVHHHGTATAGEAGSCEVLTHWFEEGEMIHLRGEHFVEIVQRFPWPDLAAGPP
jgi:hypothetical protein